MFFPRKCLLGTNDCHIKWKQHASFINRALLKLFHITFFILTWNSRAYYIAQNPGE